MSRHLKAVATASRTLDPVMETAHAVGLRYVSDSEPGFRRIRSGKSFRYVDSKGKPVKDADRLGRIRALAIPPAWTEVWICPHPDGHIQATGRDARGRKQYRYHPQWRAVRDENKFDRMVAFGKALPLIRKTVAEDMKRPGLPREKVVATVVRLLDTTFIRVGNEEYARENGSYGLTTLRRRHVDVNGSTVRFAFKGKGGKMHAREWVDPAVARVVKRCADLPGQQLFKYIDPEGEQRVVGSADVNAYLREITGRPFTAKDFRTWGGTVLAACTLYGIGTFRSNRSAKRYLSGAIEVVAAHLGNTPAISRKCYIHPALIESYIDGTLLETFKPRRDGKAAAGMKLRPDEQAVLRFLQRRARATSGASARSA